MMSKILTLWLALCLWCAPAAAAENGWIRADYLQARLVDGGMHQDHGRLAGVEIRLDEGWHAYWRMPGDGGLPPRFDWTGADNLAQADILWPVPKRFETMGLYSFGYEGTVLLPVVITPRDDGAPVALALKADIMVCKDICVPQSVALDKVLDGAAEDAPLLAEALSRLPAPDRLPSLYIENAVVGPQALVINAFAQAGFEQADLFAEVPDLYVTAVPEITVSAEDARQAQIRIAAPEGVDNLTDYIFGHEVTLTLTDGRRAIEHKIQF